MLKWFKRLFKRRAKRGSVQNELMWYFNNREGNEWRSYSKKELYATVIKYKKSSILSAISALIEQRKIELIEDGRLRKV